MAQGQAWKLGVWCPLVNHSFRYPIAYTGVLDAAYTSGTDFVLEKSGVDSILYPGHMLTNYVDYVTLGPSSNSSYLNMTERQMVVSASGTSLTVTLACANPDYDYAAGDRVCWIGSKFPGGWDAAGTMTHFGLVSTSLGTGYDDNYALVVGKGSTSSETAIIMGSEDGTSAQVLPLLEPNTYYNVGCWYKASSITTGNPTLTFSGAWGATTTLTFSTQASWTESTSVTGLSSALTTPTVPVIKIVLPAATLITGLYIDCLWMCHAKGTTTASSGYMALGTPDLGTIQWTHNDQPRYAMTMDGSSFGGVLGDDDQKYSMRAKLTNLDQTAIDDLLKMLRWQSRGNSLCLQTGIADVPPWLVGMMTVKFSKESYDLDLTSVDLTFTEV